MEIGVCRRWYCRCFIAKVGIVLGELVGPAGMEWAWNCCHLLQERRMCFGAGKSERALAAPRPGQLP
jgi:hypothetical protein